MTYTQPLGYRLPASQSLPSLSRALERFGWPLWRTEVLRAVSTVSAELLASHGDHGSVYRKWSHDQISESDLVLSHVSDGSIVYRAAEFLDIGHSLMHRMSALPLPVKLDLRCRAQLMDDPGDPERQWTYVLFGTEHQRLEDAFLQLRGIEVYALTVEDDILQDHESDPLWSARSVVWDRVLAPYTRSSPLSISAPEPQVTFDIGESLYYTHMDDEFQAQGKTTVTAVVKEVSRMLGDQAPGDLLEQLTAPIKS
ncbi:hypothetical protein [Tessaracoccus antarcticus]|uniref:Uncharacterized protein n=1 Tax=Tessaracoccus antarcticus TaxID=2479848 RepID=A0A3M0GGE4_9ACTN|nr:hypothetical protein [Tessaracoccus antarcticus]RMB60209.1 hypothetical protein EAX62_11045 [Tessaracoccus antarcticus]